MKNDVVPPTGLGSFRRVTAATNNNATNNNAVSDNAVSGAAMNGNAASADDAFGAQRPERSASSPSGRMQRGSTSLMSKLQDAFTKPANRGVLEAAVTVERIQRLRGR